MCLGLALSMFNSTIVNVMVPAIGDSFGSSSSQLQWISSLYTLLYAALLLPGGALGNRLGRRRAFLVGISGFAGGSLVCAVAPGFAVLLAGRVIQAVGAALMLPQTLSILVHEYADPRARARAVGIWAGGASLGLAAGPVLGGIVVAASTWRLGFVLSVLLALATIVLGWSAVPASRHGRPPDAPVIDLLGAAFSVISLTALVFGLIESSARGWGSVVILGAFAIFALALAAFLLSQARAERRGEPPLMPLRLWRSPGFIGANITGLVYFVTFYAVLYFFSLDLQVTRHDSALVAGLSFLPLTLVVAILGPIAGRLTATFGTGPVMVAGIVVSALGCALLAGTSEHFTLLDLQWRLAVLGIGSGLLSSPTSTAAVSSVPAAHSGSAAAVYNTFRQVGSTLGVAAVGVVVGPTDAASFGAGLDRAMWAIAGLLMVNGALTWTLMRRQAGTGSGRIRGRRDHRRQ